MYDQTFLMPLTLYRSMLGDLLRVLALTTAVLVTVIAFGATIKPFADDELLTPAQTAKYALLVTIPMLQYALPFAAAFATTIVFQRMTADNEVLAAAVSGVSYRTLLLPIFALGAVLLIAMILLTQWVVPHFWGVLYQAFARDTIKLFQASIERREPFELEGIQIYADRLVPDESPQPSDQPQDASSPVRDLRFVLHGVAVAELDENGRAASDITASRAVIDIYRLPTETRLNMAMRDAVAFKGEMLSRVPTMRLAQPIVIPNITHRDLNAMSWRQLRRLRSEPDLDWRVEDSKRDVADGLQELQIMQSLRERLRDGGRVQLRGQGDVIYIIRAGDLVENKLAPGEQALIVVEQHSGGRPRLRLEAPRAEIDLAVGATWRLPAFDLVLQNPTIHDLEGGGRPNARQRVMLTGLIPPDEAREDYMAMTSPMLLERAGEFTDVPDNIRDRFHKLQDRLGKLQLEVSSKQQRRFALSVTAPLLLVLGSLLAMWMKNTLPLAIFIWSFLPAILDVILISGGAELIDEGQKIAGMGMLWSGNVLLLAACLWVYHALARH
jgi:lipopolysaccharide export LptBFGC system permease protein LptF